MRHLIHLAAAALLAIGIGANATQAHPGADAHLIHSLYQNYLGRPADRCGLDHWLVTLRTCGNPEVVRAGILASDEYYCRYGHVPEAYVAGLYRDVLGRQPCAHEVHAWACRCQAAPCRSHFVNDFLASAQPELTLRTAPPVGPLYVPAATVPAEVRALLAVRPRGDVRVRVAARYGR